MPARLARSGSDCRAWQRQDAGDIADDVDELRAGGHHDLAVVLQRPLDRDQPAEQLCVAREVAVCRLVDELDRW
jgi:hypothetical protein